MQFNPVYLYSNKLDVYTSTPGSWSTERYRRVYNRNLKIFRGVDNRIDIQVRNADQKTSNIVGSTLVFNLVSRDSKKLVLQKDFDAMDLSSGKVTITITEEELLDLNNGSYNYSIIKEIRSTIDSTDYKVTSRMPLYMDSQYDTVGTLEISGDVYGDVDPSLVIDTFDYTNPFTIGDTTPAFYVSAIIDAKPKVNTGNSLHTFQFYSTNYDGSVVIQGSLDNQGATPRERSWADIISVDLTSESYKNIVGKWNWFRIKHIPTGGSNTATFVISQNLDYSYTVQPNNRGANYQVGNTILIEGNKLGGELVTNDLVITVTGIGTNGQISSIDWTGSSYPGVKTFVLSGTASNIGTIDKILYR
jgi:hypothetical protein